MKPKIGRPAKLSYGDIQSLLFIRPAIFLLTVIVTCPLFFVFQQYHHLTPRFLILIVIIEVVMFLLSCLNENISEGLVCRWQLFLLNASHRKKKGGKLTNEEEIHIQNIAWAKTKKLFETELRSGWFSY